MKPHGPSHNALGSTPEDDDEMGRLEYGYGSGYINGIVDEQRIGFSADDSQPAINGVKILLADQATGVDRDRFAGIIGLAPRSSEAKLAAFIAQMHTVSSFAQTDAASDGPAPLTPLFSFYLSRTPSEEGMVTFGGYDVERFAKPGLTDKNIFWANIETQEKMWTLNLNGIGIK